MPTVKKAPNFPSWNTILIFETRYDYLVSQILEARKRGSDDYSDEVQVSLKKLNELVSGKPLYPDDPDDIWNAFADWIAAFRQGGLNTIIKDISSVAIDKFGVPSKSIECEDLIDSKIELIFTDLRDLKEPDEGSQEALDALRGHLIQHHPKRFVSSAPKKAIKTKNKLKLLVYEPNEFQLLERELRFVGETIILLGRYHHETSLERRLLSRKKRLKGLSEHTTSCEKVVSASSEQKAGKVELSTRQKTLKAISNYKESWEMVASASRTLLDDKYALRHLSEFEFDLLSTLAGSLKGLADKLCAIENIRDGKFHPATKTDRSTSNEESAGKNFSARKELAVELAGLCITCFGGCRTKHLKKLLGVLGVLSEDEKVVLEEKWYGTMVKDARILAGNADSTSQLESYQYYAIAQHVKTVNGRRPARFRSWQHWRYVVQTQENE